MSADSHSWHSIVLEIVVFVCGAATMIMELLGSRVLAPYVGASLYVWTSLIGVMLGALSYGYWRGGQYADRRPQIADLSRVILIAGVLVGATAIFDHAVLLAVEYVYADTRFVAIVGTLILFGFPSFFLGMVLPYAVRLSIMSVDETGRTVGRLYALSTLGSIAGTFVAGFFLIAYFGHTKILLAVSLLLIMLSLVVGSRWKARSGILAALITGLLVLQPPSFARMVMGPDFIDADTPYSRAWIYDGIGDHKEPIRMLQVNEEQDSAMLLHGDGLAFEYTKYYSLIGHFVPDLHDTLMIGGAAYSYPMHYLAEFPQARIDVVEIDPGITAIARQYFKLKDDPRLRIFIEDGRPYLNRSTAKYDAILLDAFRSYSIPFQLTTIEAVREIYSGLNDNGVAVVNVASAIEGDAGMFLRAEYATYKSVFPNVYLFTMTNPRPPNVLQNLILVATKSALPPKLQDDNPEFAAMLRNRWVTEIPHDVPVLTDDRAPVEHLIENMVRRNARSNNPLYQKTADRLRPFLFWK